MSQDSNSSRNKGIDYSFLPGMFGYEEQGEASVSKDSAAIGRAENEVATQKTTNVTTLVLQSDADEVDRIMSTIHTGEDAINFFARFGSDTPLKFVNLFQIDDPKEFRPYDLVIGEIKDNHLEVEHYSMSPSGIVHVVPGYSSECISLANWTRQAMMFRILRKIPFYKYYLHRKTFYTWRSNVRFSLYARQRKKVYDRLFLARNSTYGAILSVKRILTDIKDTKLIVVENRTCEKDVFLELQNSNLAQCAHVFEESLRLIVRDVKSVLTTVHNIHGNAVKEPEADTFSGE